MSTYYSTYIKGYHAQAPQREFWWKAKKKLVRQGVKPGDEVWVETQFGVRWIVVTEILQQECSRQPPSPAAIRMAYGLKKG